MAMTSDPLNPDEVLPAIHRAIADLKLAGIPVPTTLYLAAIVLSFLERRQP